MFIETEKKKDRIGLNIEPKVGHNNIGLTQFNRHWVKSFAPQTKQHQITEYIYAFKKQQKPQEN